MDAAGTEFAELLQRVRAGDPEASRLLVERYSPHVYRVVRRCLAQRLRRCYDSQDFLQAVWSSFFLVPAERFAFNAPEELIGFLARLATHKVIDAYRGQLASRKRDVGREPALLPIAEADDATNVPARQPTASQLAMADEEWERLVRDQSPGRRHVLELLRLGHTREEVAARTGIHVKAIQRLVRKLRAGAGRA